MKARLMFIALTLFYSSAWSAEPKIWKGEVASLRSLDIGTEIAKFPECPKITGKYSKQEKYPSFTEDFPSDFKDRACLEMPSKPSVLKAASSYQISNLPFIMGAGIQVEVVVIAEKIEAIEFEFTNSRAEYFLSALTEKYGAPTEQKSKQYQNGFGKIFDGTEAKWQGKNVTLTYDEFTNNINWGRIGMYSKVFYMELNKQSLENTKAIKSGL